MIAVWVLVAAACPAAETGRNATDAAGSGAPAEARKIGAHLYALGNLTIDAEKRIVRCPGAVNMSEGGPIELLACRPEGKVHESVLTLDVAPLDLQAALLLLDLAPGRNPGVRYPDGDDELSRPPGDMVDIYVEWDQAAEDGKAAQRVRRRADEMLHNVVTEQPMQGTQWVFTGSRWVEGRFGAEFDGSLVTTFHDPYAILELPLREVNDDVWYIVSKDVVPAVGTEVEVIFQAPGKDVEEHASEGEKTEGE